MHVILCILITIVTFKQTNWRNWKKYHSTMLFLPMMNLVYNFLALSSDHFLLKMKSGILKSHALIELTYSAILLPCTVLLFLSTFPENPIRILLHFLKYIFVYSCFEVLVYILGGIEYRNGWSIWYSIIFYFLMFPAIITHYKKPVLAYIIFILITISGVWYFNMQIR